MKRILLSTCFVVAAGAATAATQSIDFETNSSGDVITDIALDGVNVSVTVDSRGSFDQAMVFDTSPDNGGAVSGQDTDLAAPFTDTSGSGDILDPNNVLIISEDGDASDPDDERRGGTITFEFDKLVNILGFDALDDVSLFVETDTGDSTTVDVAADNEFASVTLDWTNVTSITFDFGRQSGAIDNIQFSVVPLPGALPLLLAGLGGLGLMRRRKRA